MKKTLLIVALATMWLAAQPAAAALSSDTAAGLVMAATSLQNQPSAPSPPDASVDIKVEKDAAWYANPVWLAIGGLAVLLLIVLIVMAARGGGGSTVVTSK